MSRLNHETDTIMPDFSQDELSAAAERRREIRVSGADLLYPFSIVFKIRGKNYTAEIINFHHRGSCVRFATTPPLSDLDDQPTYFLDFFVGKKILRRDVPFRICWESLTLDGMMGVEFLLSKSHSLQRSERFNAHPHFAPILSCTDPLDANRKLFLKILNVSENGMLLLSSLTNRHLLPGMMLQGELVFPGQPPALLKLQIENTRISSTQGMFELGISVVLNKDDYLKGLRNYLPILSPSLLQEHYLDSLADNKLVAKKIKHGLSFSIASTPKQYEKILKLRYKAYQHHGKVRPGSSWSDLGEGLSKEGMIVIANLGGHIVASFELRFGNGNLPLRTLSLIGQKEIPGIELSQVVEINKLSIHPKVQGSDIIVGMMQKIHAILVAKGGFDVLIQCTDALLHLYTRIGFKKTGFTAPHPIVPGVQLNVIYLPKETYLEAREINPYTWIVIYEETQKFMESIGLTRPVKLTWQNKLTVMLSKLFLKMKGKDSRDASKTGAGVNNGFIHPRLTSQHIIAPIMLPYVLEADAMIGRDKVDGILSQIGISREFISKQGNWLSIAFLDEFMDAFSIHGNIAELSRRSGERALQPDVIGMKYYFLKHFVTPEIAFQSFEKILSKFNRTRTYKLLEFSRGRAKVAVGSTAKNLLPKHKESCLNWESSFLTYIRIMTNQVGAVRKTACCYQNHPACIYEITWHARGNKIRSLVLSAIALLGLMVGLAVASFFTKYALIITPSAAVFFTLVGWLSYELFQSARERKSFTKHFEVFEHESNERYSELQNAKNVLDERYREAKLLEETSKAIQASNEYSSILGVTLDNICQNFGFDRAFIMLTNENKTLLSTAALSGVIEGATDIWQFTVDVSVKRENPALLSSVYHSGNPVLISDVGAHLFQLNEASKSIIKKLASQGFVMVPIPSERSNWGVLIADKIGTEKLLSRSDLMLLQRVSKHLGIALDKQSKLDQETRLRKLFQKYVPSEILKNLTSISQPSLGGQIRDIACMFIDIRDFTKSTSKLSPLATVEFLNRVFSMIQEVVTETQGWIDKFMGDGVFVTWGAVGSEQADCSQSVKAALKILERLNPLNARFLSEGMDPIRIGIGIHSGTAIVGNMGSEDRMEYTCIGSTVNLAARLENLCKTLGGAVIISEEVLRKLPEILSERFETVDDISIRGVSGTIRIGIIRGPRAVDSVQKRLVQYG